MKTRIQIAFILLVCITIKTTAQLSPQDAIKAMGRGINMGNTLEPPGGEGTWGNPAATEKNFEDYHNAGFGCVRLPITWDNHTATTPPYAINATWLNRIEEIIDWGLKYKLVIIINAHHEDWIKNSYTIENKARFDSVWSQISARFKDKSDSLLFEMINEPNPLSLANVNDLNARTLQIIRKTNPTRIVLYSGHMWSNSAELIQAAVLQDNYIIGYYHSYDPWPFGLEGPGTYGSDADIAATVAKFVQVTNWGNAHNVPVVLGEFGFTKKCEYNSRMCAYATIAEKAQIYNVPCMVWEDGGDFKFYNRNERTWSEIKDVLINTYPESPYKMKIMVHADTLIKIQWTNRTTLNDSITVERKIDNGNFTFLAKLNPAASEFIDSTTSIGKAFYYRLRANLQDSIEIQSYPIMLRILPTYRAPFSGTPIDIPGTVECEDYDFGGEGLTFHDIDEVNQGGSSYRTDGVDIGQHAAGQLHVGYVAAGEWLEYTINVLQSGTYTITASYAAGGSAGGQFNLKFNNGTTTSFTTVATGSWTTYTDIEKTFSLDEGEQIMRLNIVKTPEFDIDYLSFSILSSVDEENIPDRFQLFDNYPNPFNPSTTFSFNLPSRTFVTLKIFDVIGREVAMVVSDELPAGNHAWQWDAQGLTSGVYFYRIQAGDFSETKKLMILK